MAGSVCAVVGPSGAGKDTLMREAARLRPDLHLVRRVITRPEEAGGEPFEGVSAAEFARRRAAGAFVLDWEAHGLRYGIPESARAAAEAGRAVVFNGSRTALARAAEVFPGLRVILVTAPPEVLAARLAARRREPPEEIARRLARGGYALPPEIPVVEVCNGDALEDAVPAFLAALQPVRA